MFSRSAGYAVQALAYLATQSSGRLTGAREIAAATRIPMPFLWKILRNLSRKRLVRSFKGVRGGYELARSAELITIKQVLEAAHDGVLLHDADQKKHADEGDHIQFAVGEQQGEQGADACGWQRRQDSDGMNVAFVQDAEHDVNGEQRGQDQDRFTGQ